MDPITAWGNVVCALLQFATEIVKGQSPDQKQQVWQHVIDDLERARKVFHIE